MAQERYDFIDEDFLSRLERLHIAAKRMTTRSSAGARRSRRMGDGLEFADHRDYSPGDDFRFIDWACFARMDKLLLRLFHQHSESDVAVLLDCSASMAPAGEMTKFNCARRAAAALAYVAMGSLQRVLVAPFSDSPANAEPLHTPPNRAAIFGVLDFLQDLAPAGRTELSAFVRRFCQRHRPAGTAVIVSDLLDCRDELDDALARLRLAGWETSVLHLFSPSDAQPTLAGPLLLRGAEANQRLSLDVGEELLAAYRRGWSDFTVACRRLCRERQANYIPVPADVPLDILILHTLRRAGVLTA